MATGGHPTLPDGSYRRPMDTHPIHYCDSCGDTDDTLMAVRRLYVTTLPPADDTIRAGDADGSEPLVTPGDTEVWCEVCRIHYPHELMGEQV